MTQNKDYFLRQLHGALLGVHQERLRELKWYHDECLPDSPSNQKFRDTYIDLRVTDILNLKNEAIAVGKEGPLVKTTSQRFSVFDREC